VTNRLGILLICLAALCWAGGCAKPARQADAAPGHPYRAPHQGTIVALGRDEFHVEFVRDSKAGTLTAYLFDGTMTIPVRSKSSGFEVVATVGGEKRSLTFTPQPDTARDEAPGDTARFAAHADWLKSTSKFEAELSSIKLLNTTFLRVKFPFPEGNEKP
jgi:hypothetical protein